MDKYYVTKNLWHILAQKNISNGEFAQQIGVQQATVSRWRHRRYPVSISNRKRIESFLYSLISVVWEFDDIFTKEA